MRKVVLGQLDGLEEFENESKILFKITDDGQSALSEVHWRYCRFCPILFT